MKKYVLCVNVNGEEFGIDGYTNLEEVKNVVKSMNDKDSKRNVYYKTFESFTK